MERFIASCILWPLAQAAPVIAAGLTPLAAPYRALTRRSPSVGGAADVIGLWVGVALAFPMFHLGSSLVPWAFLAAAAYYQTTVLWLWGPPPSPRRCWAGAAEPAFALVIAAVAMTTGVSCTAGTFLAGYAASMTTSALLWLRRAADAGVFDAHLAPPGAAIRELPVWGAIGRGIGGMAKLATPAPRAAALPATVGSVAVANIPEATVAAALPPIHITMSNPQSGGFLGSMKRAVFASLIATSLTTAFSVREYIGVGLRFVGDALTGDLLSRAKEKVDAVKEKISDKLGDAKEAIGNKAGDIKEGLQDRWDPMQERIKDQIGRAKAKAKRKIQQNYNQFKDRAADELGGVARDAMGRAVFGR